jgi:hypothetical protein
VCLVLFITLFILVLVARSAPAALEAPCRINPLAAEQASKSLQCVKFFILQSNFLCVLLSSPPTRSLRLIAFRVIRLVKNYWTIRPASNYNHLSLEVTPPGVRLEPATSEITPCPPDPYLTRCHLGSKSTVLSVISSVVSSRVDSYRLISVSCAQYSHLVVLSRT